MPATHFKNLLEITGVPADCTFAQVEAIIVAAAGGNEYIQIHMDDASYANFRNSVNINEGNSVASKATQIFSDSQGRFLKIINAFHSLMQIYNA